MALSDADVQKQVSAKLGSRRQAGASPAWISPAAASSARPPPFLGPCLSCRASAVGVPRGHARGHREAACERKTRKRRKSC